MIFHVPDDDAESVKQTIEEARRVGRAHGVGVITMGDPKAWDTWNELEVKITDSWLVDVRLSGLVGNLVVNDVDVTAYVEGELDNRHPERVQLRAMRAASDYRAMWDTIEDLWAQTVARAGRLPGPALHQRVDGEWSLGSGCDAGPAGAAPAADAARGPGHPARAAGFGYR